MVAIEMYPLCIIIPRLLFFFVKQTVRYTDSTTTDLLRYVNSSCCGFLLFFTFLWLLPSVAEPDRLVYLVLELFLILRYTLSHALHHLPYHCTLINTFLSALENAPMNIPRNPKIVLENRVNNLILKNSHSLSFST